MNPERVRTKKERIILMAKLAVYDKNQAEKDAKTLSYFQTDYVYRRNIWVRFCVLIGCLIVIFLNIVHRIEIDRLNPLSGVDYRQELLGAAVFIVVAMTVYSFVGTAVYVTDYQKAKKRRRKYYKMLEALDQPGQKQIEEV